MKSVIFWALFLLIGITILYVTYSKVDSFIDASAEMKSLKGLSEEPKFVVPEALPAPPPIGPEDVQPYAPPTFSLLSPPPGGVAVVNSLPYKDPSEEKAPLSRIKNVLETAYGFLRNEAPEIEKSSNPALTLPLTTLRGDIQRLKDEVSVLSLNPGIESTLSQSDLDDMEANLSYLQKKWRRQTDNKTSIEGFEDVEDISGNDVDDPRASLNDLRDVAIKIQVEIARLSALSATDPLISNRISKLSVVSSEVEGIISKVENGTMTTDMIPITKKNIESFLPLIMNPNSILPATLKSGDLSPSLASLLPAWLIGDVSGSELTTFIVNNYLDTFFRGLSWDMRLNYTASRLKDVADAKEKTSENTLDGLKLALENTKLTQANALDATTQASAAATNYRGQFASATTLDSQGGTTTTNTSSPASAFDWHERSKQICEAIGKNGYEPGDFGCMNEDATVGPNFSWRGYTRMICTRVGTLYDPGAPESCGCPPVEWSGWRA